MTAAHVTSCKDEVIYINGYKTPLKTGSRPSLTTEKNIRPRFKGLRSVQLYTHVHVQHVIRRHSRHIRGTHACYTSRWHVRGPHYFLVCHIRIPS